MPSPKGAIALKHVSFAYKPGGQEVLKDITLGIRPGEVVGIVGPSGSGKSDADEADPTALRPERGAKCCWMAPISPMSNPAWLRRHIGVVLQENLLFNRTIHDNIRALQPGDAARAGHGRGAPVGRR